MMTRTRRRYFLAMILCVVIFIAVFVALLLRRSAPSYNVTFLPLLGEAMIPHAINDHGQVVGTARISRRNYRLFLWDQAGGMRDLGPTDGSTFYISNVGQIAGSVRDLNGNRRAFIREPDGAVQLLGTLGGDHSIALAINNHGEVVGESWTAQGMNHAFFWTRATGMRDLGPPNTTQSSAVAIGDNGCVIGFSAELGWFLWDPNDGFLSKDPSIAPRAAGDISNRGYAAFVSSGAGRKPSVLIRHPRTGLWMKLFQLRKEGSVARINDANQVLFYEMMPPRLKLLGRPLIPARVKQYLWDPMHGRVSVDRHVSLDIGERFFARDMNNRGCIVGQIDFEDRSSQAVLLEPIPERWGR